MEGEREKRLFRINDLFLLLVIFCSMAAGIGLPEFASVFLPYPLYLLMLLLFLSFLRVEFANAFQEVRETTSFLFILCLVKLLVLPTGLYFLTRAVLPEYAL